MIKSYKDNIIKKRLEKGMNLLLKNKIDKTGRNISENNNGLINSNWNHSSNYKAINTYSNENILYKNKFSKNTPLNDKLLEDNNRVKGVILPNINLKSPCFKKDNANLSLNNNNFSHFTKLQLPKESISNYNDSKNKVTSDKANIYRNIKLNKIINNYNINDTQTTQSATNSTKNQTSSKNNIIQNLKDDLNQYEMGLVSIGSNKSNNIIIPILTKRPVSNFNCGGKIIQKISENEDKGRNVKNELIRISQSDRNKVCKSQEKKKFNISIKNKEAFKMFSGVQKLMPNFHKIKIEKGMITNNNLLNSYSKKVSFDYKSKNNINFYENNIQLLE